MWVEQQNNIYEREEGGKEKAERIEMKFSEVDRR